MRGELGFDPFARSYGPATSDVRRILVAWSEVEWFAPPADRSPAEAASGLARPLYRAPASVDVDPDPGVRLLEQHHGRASALAPGKLAPALRVDRVRGDWRRFAALRDRVCKPGAWDWRYSVLKVISSAHSDARGFRLQDQPAPEGMVSAPAPGDLFVRFGEVVIWTLSLRVDLSGLAPDRAECARWYLGYANMDFLHCIEWQLADPGGCLDDNPSWPLVRCYAAGLYPFGMGPDSFVGFSFSA